MNIRLRQRLLRTYLFILLFFQFMRNHTAIETGVRLLPLVCHLVFTVIINSALMFIYEQ